jgi:hypothetical protein
LAAVFAVAVEAGTIDSSSGNPSVTPMPTEERPAGQRLLGDEHGSSFDAAYGLDTSSFGSSEPSAVSRLVNGVLFTIPRNER